MTAGVGGATFSRKEGEMDQANYNYDVLDRQLQRIDSMAAVRFRKKQTANVWIFQSPKNGKRFAIEGDSVFFACILYEADTAVSWYLPEPVKTTVLHDHKSVVLQYDIEVHYVDGHTEWVKLSTRSTNSKKTNYKVPSNAHCLSAQNQKEGTFRVIEKEDLSKNWITFQNWLVLCAAMTRIRYYPQHKEAALQSKELSKKAGISLKELLQLDDCDPGIMLGVIATGLKIGELSCDLTKRLLSRDAIISLSRHVDTSNSFRPNKPINSVHSEFLCRPSHACEALTSPSKWPTPDVSQFPESVREKYFRRKNAVLMRLDGAAPDLVASQFGIGEREQRRLIARCKVPTESGGVIGFYACIEQFRVTEYKRTQEVVRIKSPHKGGCAGALQQLFRMHPDVQKLVKDLYLGYEVDGKVVEPVESKRDIWRDFKKVLRSLGYTDSDWPFNTKSIGYVSLSEYLNSLHQKDYRNASKARYGDDAARRTSIGTGELPLIEAHRPFSIMELDYQMVDAHSIFLITNRFGDKIEVHVRRWYYGLMGDANNGLITGVFIGFEEYPSSDCALKIIDSSLRPQVYSDDDPRIAYIVDGRILPNELLPSLSYQCFNVLRVDNGWANAARATVNAVIDVVGCAVNFGPKKGWWHRPVVESIFHDLTKRGLQRLPSSLGCCPSDPKRNKPEEKAGVFRIDISEVTGVISGAVRAHNDSLSSGREFSSPLQAIAGALANDRSGYIPQLLPKAALDDKRLLTHVQECTVTGNPKKGIRPHVKWDNCRYHNPILANRDDLIGCTLILYANLDDIRDVIATVKETGEDIGRMVPEARWRHRPVSVRFRKLINRDGEAKRAANEADDPVEIWKRKKSEQLAESAAKSRGRSRKQSIPASHAAHLSSAHESGTPTVQQHTSNLEPKEKTNGAAKVYGHVDFNDLFAVVRKD